MAQCQRLLYKHTMMSNAWYLITVPNTNKITTFFSTKSLPSKFMNKLILLKFGTEPNSILHASVTHGTQLWYPIWRKSIQQSWRNVQGWTNWQTDGLDPCQFTRLHLSGAGNNNSLILTADFSNQGGHVWCHILQYEKLWSNTFLLIQTQTVKCWMFTHLEPSGH